MLSTVSALYGHLTETGVVAANPELRAVTPEGRLKSGEWVFSETEEFQAQAGWPIRLDLEMKRGIRLEGRLDGQVARLPGGLYQRLYLLQQLAA